MNLYFVTIDNREYSITFESEGIVVVSGKRVPVDIRQVNPRSFSILMSGKSETVIVDGTRNPYQLYVNGKQSEAVVESERIRLLKKIESQSSKTTSQSEVRAPMPALVIKIEVHVGEDIKEGQGLIVLEAMKMENEIKAHRAGRVKEIHVRNRTPVEKGELIMTLEE